MINIEKAKRYCKDDIRKIENYDLAITDITQTWICHHRLELTLDGELAHTPKELMRLEMYYKRPYFELIFLTRSEHRKLHDGTQYARQRNSENQKGKSRTEFGEKFIEHFGIISKDNIKLYNTEYYWYKRHKKCRWEK